MRIQVNDTVTYSLDSNREYTKDGFLKVPATVARTGIQEYYARELGLTNRKPFDVVRVYRPADEVFKQSSLDSYDGADVTIEHPKGMVKAATFKDVSKGFVKGSARRDGDFVIADLVIKSQDAIDAINAGKTQVSAGYLASYHEEVGTTDSGEKYDFIQRDIDINHVAIVDRARAGAQARLFDSQKTKGAAMQTITTDSGRVIEINDSNAVAIAEAFDQMRKALDASYKKEEEAKAKAASAEEKADKAEAKADEQEEELEKEKAKTSDAAIAERIEMIMTVKDAALKIAGDKFTSDSMDVIEIMRDTMKSVNDSIDWDDRSDTYVAARFDAAYDHAIEAPKHSQLSQDSQKAFSQSQDQAPKMSAYDSHKMNMANAWKKSLNGGK